MDRDLAACARPAFIVHGRPEVCLCSVLIPPGVLVPLALADEVAAALLAALRRGMVPASVELLQLIGELERAATGTGARPAGTGRWTATDEWVTVTSAAALLDISPRAVRKRIAAGGLPARKLGGRWWLSPSRENGH